MVKLFTTYIRPLVEYAWVAQSPVEVGLYTQLEEIQCRCTAVKAKKVYFSARLKIFILRKTKK